jgi:hypothetical protein
MTDRRGAGSTLSISSQSGVVPSYERPRLVPMGNLRDLLAGAAQSGCDAGSETLGSMTPGPAGTC